MYELTHTTLPQIAIEVCTKHGIKFFDLVGEKQKAPIVLARQEFCYRAVNETGRSLPAVGRFISRDHSTVSYSVKKHAERIAVKAGE
jgi:chromosomal replication initiation ATPase DnaA